MSNHADFASVAVVNENVINNIIRIYYRNRKFPIEFKREIELRDPIPFKLGLVLTMDCPSVDLEASSSGKIKLKVSFYGLVNFTPSIGLNNKFTLILDLEVQVAPILIWVDGSRVQIGLDFTNTLIDKLDLSILEGQRLNSNQGNALHSVSVRREIQDWLRHIGNPSQNFPITPELLSNLSQLNLVPTSIKFKIMKNALALAVDSLSTHGDLDQVVDFTGDSGIAASSNPILVDALIEWAKANTSRFGDVTVDELNYELEAMNLKVWGQATYHTAKLLPNVTVSYFARARPSLSSQRVEVDVYDTDIDLPWWAKLLGFFIGVLTLGSGSVIPIAMFSVLGVVLSVIVSSVVEDMVEGLCEKDIRALRTHHMKLPETNGPEVAIHIDDLRVGTEGIEMWCSLKFNDIEKPSHLIVPSFDRTTTAPIKLKCEVKPSPTLYHPLDYRVRVRWSVKRGEDTYFLIENDIPIGMKDALTCSFEYEPLTTSQGYIVSVRIYRPNSDGTTEELFHDSECLILRDRLDRRHPYVRWKHKVEAPIRYTVRRKGRLHTYYKGMCYQERVSAIHRTDVPGRCRFASSYTNSTTRIMEYMDELPVPHDQILANRAMFCDYCFFGGPDKDKLLID